jgi:hypothetical protein
MAGTDEKAGQRERQGNQPFVGGDERPEVRLDPDMPIGEMRVRDLTTLLGGSHESVPAVLTDLLKRKTEYFEFKLVKNEKYEIKEKIEKLEHKHEKWEYAEPVWPRIPGPEPDPRLDELIRAVSQLREEVAALKAGGR